MRSPRGGGGRVIIVTGSPSTRRCSRPAANAHRHKERVRAADAHRDALRVLGCEQCANVLKQRPWALVGRIRLGAAVR